MIRHWRARESDSINDFELSLHPIVLKLLQVRGFTSKEEIKNFVTSSLKDMKSPYLLKDMEKLVKRFYQAYQKQENILIYGDFDLDGSSGVALLYNGLKSLGFQNIYYFQPKRLKDGYGLHANFIPNFKKQGIDLILTVDVGITAIEAAKVAKQEGIDLIISDHHQAKEDLPNAYAVVNPNRKDCLAGLDYLCGAGVAYYILLALKMFWEKEGIKHNFSPKEVLEYFIIGTLTDMVPLINENRALIKHGKLALEKTDKAGLRVLLQSLNLWGRPLSSQDIAIGMAPKLNALSRMERGLLPVDILLEKDESEALKKMHKVLELNDLRKDLQKQAEEEAEIEFLNQKNQKFALIYSKNFHKGVIGLVATAISNRYNVPAFIGTLLDSGEIVGSARSPNIDIYSQLSAYEATKDHMISFGGHHFASGFKVHIDSIEKWRKSLEKYFDKVPKTNIHLDYDLELKLEDLDLDLLRALDQLQPFGKSFEVPLFCVRKTKIKALKRLRGGHLRLNLEQNATFKTALYFSPPVAMDSLREGEEIDVLVEMQWNYFNGKKSLQLLVKDLKRNEN